MCLRLSLKRKSNTLYVGEGATTWLAGVKNLASWGPRLCPSHFTGHQTPTHHGVKKTRWVHKSVQNGTPSAHHVTGPSGHHILYIYVCKQWRVLIANSLVIKLLFRLLFMKMPQCNVRGCNNRSENAFKNNIKFFSFLRNPEIVKKWISVCKNTLNLKNGQCFYTFFLIIKKFIHLPSNCSKSMFNSLWIKWL